MFILCTPHLVIFFWEMEATHVSNAPSPLLRPTDTHYKGGCRSALICDMAGPGRLLRGPSEWWRHGGGVPCSRHWRLNLHFVQRSSWPVQSSTICVWTMGMSWKSQRSSLRILPPLLQFNSSRREVEPTSGTGFVPRFLHPNNLGPCKGWHQFCGSLFFYILYSKYKFGVEWNALLCFAILSNLVLCLTFSVQW